LYNHGLAKLKSLLQFTLSAYVKTLRHGAEEFASLPNKGVLRISIALKNLSTSPDLNQRTLNPMASMLTIRPPKPSKIS
jgi:hypothetical protein